MISSGDFASLEATLRNSDVASRHYSHAIQYRAGSRHFWPPTPPPDGRYGAAGNGRPPSVMMPADLYFDHLHHHKSYLATPPPLDSAGHPSAFSMYGGGMPPKSDPRREIKRYPLPPAPSSKPVPIHHHPQQQQPPPQHHYRHPSVIVKQEVAEEPVQPTNLVVKSSRLPNKFIHSIQNSPFSPPTSQSALSSLQTLVEQNGCPKLKHAPPVGCVLPMPSNPRPEPKKFPCSADGNIPIGIAHAHQRPKDLSCDQIDANPSPLKSHLLSKPPQQPMGLMRDFKDECLEKSPYPSSYPGVPSHHSSGVLPPGTRWPWLPPVWPPAPEGCQLVKDPRTGQLLLLEAAGSYALMGPPTTSSHMWTPVPPPGGTSCCDIKAGIPKLEEEKKAEEPLAIIKKEAPPTPSPPAKPEQEEVIDLTVTLKEEEPPPLQPAPPPLQPAPPPPEAVEPPATDGLQLLLDGIELKKPSPSNFELLCSYAHEVFEKEQMTTPPSRVVHKSEVAKKVQSLTAPGNPPVVEPDPTEVKIRQQLADLQRKYQENQRGLAELVPKKKTSKHKPNRPKKTICALEPVPTTTTTTPTIPVPTKAAVKQPVEVDQEIDVPLSRLRQVAKPDDKKPPSKLKRTLSGSTFALPRPKKSSTPSSASSSSSSGSPKKSQPTDSSSPSTESESSPKKELKPKPINVKNEKGQKSLQLVRKRKFFRSRRHSRSETSEPPVEKVSRNLITKLEANDNSGDEEEVSEESFEKKRLRTKSEKKTETAKSRLSKTQASLSIRKQMGQQQKTTPEKKDKQAVVKRTRLSLVKRQSSSRSQRSAGDDSSDFSPDSTPVKRGLRKEEDACLLRDQDMVENARVLVLEDGLLYPGVIIDIQPPKVYGVMLDGGRGTSPRLFSRDELGRQAVQEVQPSKLLPEGSRVCAYWSQHYQCLYPGVVSKGDNAGGSPDGKTMFVQFDDGDSGKIPLSDIRLLASHITDPSRSPSPEPAESPRSLRKKKQQQAGKPAEKKKKASVIRPSLRLRLSRALRQRSSPGYHHFYHRSRMAAVTPKPEKQSPTKNETKATTENLWRWCGKPVRKIGAKGKTKREYFKAIIRKNEKIVLGECVAFCGRNSPHVGQVQNLWQTCSGGSMVVRVRWFYLPQELKNSTPHLPKGGLYQTSHEEDSDVQAISHKCQVIPYEEFCQRPSTDSMYYLAGEYDLASGAVSARVS